MNSTLSYNIPVSDSQSWFANTSITSFNWACSKIIVSSQETNLGNLATIGIGSADVPSSASITSFNWACSKMVLHLHGMEEVGVRFSSGPQHHQNTF